MTMTYQAATYHAAGELDERLGAVNPYPTNDDLIEWMGALQALHGRGVRLILDWGGRVSPKLDEKIAEARAAAEEAGKCPDKAGMQVRKSPMRSGWTSAAPDWPTCEEHLLRGGWVSWAPEEHGAIELDIDTGDVEATAAALRGTFQVAGETVSVSGKRRLIVRYDPALSGRKRPKKTWRMDEGAGECLANKAIICDPHALLAALDVLPEVKAADLSRLRAGGASKQADFTFDAEADEDALAAAVEDAVEKIEDAPEGEGNDTVWSQAWRAGKAAGTSEAMDADGAREAILDAAVRRQPGEVEKALETARRGFDEGAESAKDEPFRVRKGGGQAFKAPGIDPAILEGEVVTDDDVEALNRWWEHRSHVVPFEPPDMSEGGKPIPDPHGLQEIRDGVLGFVNDLEAVKLLGAENAFPDHLFRFRKQEGTRAWEYTEGAGWRPRDPEDVHPDLGEALHGRRYYQKPQRVNEGTDSAPIWRTLFEKVNRPTESSASAFVDTVMRRMGAWMPWYTDPAWHDANPWQIAHPDGTLTDLQADGTRPMARCDRLMKRTAVSPVEWRGSWVEAYLEETVPGKIDRLMLQCGLGACCIGRAFGEVMLWLVGPGGSGKTGLLEAAQAALGDDYTHTIRVERLLEQRQAPGGFGKESSQVALHEARMALVAGEPRSSDVLDDGEYKSLTGGGSSEGRRIGKDSKALYRSPFTMAGSCNTLPFVKGRDPAVQRRTYVVACPNERTDDESRDASVKERLLTEEHLGALLGFMLEGARMIALRGQMPPRTEQQIRRALFPLKDGTDKTEPERKPREAQAHDRAERLFREVKVLIEERTRPLDAGFVWLNEQPEGADPEFLDHLDSLLKAAEWEISPTSRGKAVSGAGFPTGRKRPGGGDRAVYPAILRRVMRTG